MDYPLSIVIPAYNSPALLKRCLESVVAQTYRPLEIVIADDHSPADLTKLVDDLQFSDGLSVAFHRSSQNLGPYWNLQRAWALARGKYLLIMPHDDYLIEKDFIRTAVDALQNRTKATVFVGNSLIEHTDQTTMTFSAPGTQTFDGTTFITKMLWGTTHPAYSAVVIDNERLQEMNYGSTFIEKSELKGLDIEPDELFVGIVLAALDSEVIVSGTVSSVRGMPSESYSRSEFWQKRGAYGVFLVCWKMIEYLGLSGRDVERRFFITLITGRYALDWFNYSILRHLNFSPFVFLLMAHGVLRRFVIRAKGKIIRTLSLARRFTAASEGK